MSSVVQMAMLFGLCVATPAYCEASEAPGVSAGALPAIGGGTSILFQPLLNRKLTVFFTPHFETEHTTNLNFFRIAANTLGSRCRAQELDSAANANDFGNQAMIIDNLADFSDVVKQRHAVQRARCERGTYHGV